VTWTPVTTADTSEMDKYRRDCATFFGDVSDIAKNGNEYNVPITGEKLLLRLDKNIEGDLSTKMFELHYFEEGGTSDQRLKMALAFDRTLMRSVINGKAARNHFCITLGISRFSSTTATEIYPIVRDKIKAEMSKARKFALIWPSTAQLNFNNRCDQVFQEMVRSNDVTFGSDETTAAYAHFAKSLPPGINLVFRPIKSIP